MKVPLLGVNVDERFLQHRLRSTSLGGIAGVLVAGGFFEYDLVRLHQIRWDLASVILTMVVVKLTCMTWYHFRD